MSSYHKLSKHFSFRNFCPALLSAKTLTDHENEKQFLKAATATGT